MTNEEIKRRLLKTVDQTISDGRKMSRLTQIEQEFYIVRSIWAIGHAALNLLSNEDYFKFKEEVTKRGYLL